MDYRINTPAVVIAAAVVLAALGLFAYTYLQNEREQPPRAETEAPIRTPRAFEQTLTAKHQFKDGKHVIVGTMELPTPCHEIAGEPFFVGEQKEGVEVRFTTSAPSGMCAQVVTPKAYKVTFEAPENASITALLDGTPVTFNRIPAEPGEDLNAFDVSVKG